MASGVRFARFFGGFVCGVTVSTGACVAAVRIYLHPEENILERDSAAQRIIKLYGLPVAGAETRYYTNHILSYDQSKRTPRWVAEHLSAEKLLGKADRKHCKFKADPNVPELFTAHNEDYLGSGWSRGHMAPAGDNKFSEQSMVETFYLSNIVPQNYENNAGFWNRLEMYCRELTERFRDVWVISGPLTLPQPGEDKKKTVSYQLIGKDDVAVPTHLYKVILVRKDPSSDVLALGAFVVPNVPISFDHQLKEYQVSLSELERMSGLTFFPKLDTSHSVKNLCLLDSCELMDFKHFTLYITGRKVKGVRSLAKLEKIMAELKEIGITPDEYLNKLYFERKQELLGKESPQVK
ncbi:nuclease EXOG, mitochondrial-like [Clarias gariepinus]|uniref:nuclease EXOG, mitochondrial-like n=1 Tax=Clarias gariepinus TaxID=13013 RepID=UPI00234CE96A|nr:nuclease EXOG, mitochondrial-like [Clarias gariepinus]